MPCPYAGVAHLPSTSLGFPTTVTLRGPCPSSGAPVLTDRTGCSPNLPLPRGLEPDALMSIPYQRGQESADQSLCLFPLWLRSLALNLLRRLCTSSVILHSYFTFFLFFNLWTHFKIPMQMENASPFIMLTKAWCLAELLAAEL